MNKDKDRFEFLVDGENGMIIGPDGCHYADQTGAMYFGQTEFCGCGDSESIHRLIIKFLTAVHKSGVIDYKEIGNIILKNNEQMVEFVLLFLDSKNLTEHGSSVYGSWLTERGKQFVEIGLGDEN